MIDRYLIRYFLAVMDQGNFSRAAQQCAVTQPTLSVGIAKLEGLVGAALFLRTNRRVELTPAGTRFADHARRIEAEFAAAERSAIDGAPGALIRLGVVATLPSAWIEDAIAAARAAAPDERLELVEGRMRDLLPRLERGRIDAVLGPLGEDRGGVTLFEEGYALALPAAHRLAGRARIEADEVAGEAMIVRRQCEALPEISRFFTMRGVRPFMAARTVNDDRALAYVRSGLGITVMPRGFAGTGIAMPALAGFDLRRRIGLRARDGAADRLAASGAHAAFVAALRNRHRATPD